MFGSLFVFLCLLVVNVESDCTSFGCVNGECVAGIPLPSVNFSLTDHPDSGAFAFLEEGVSSSHSCQCDPGFTGRNCGITVNACDGHACFHGGVCRNSTGTNDQRLCDCRNARVNGTHWVGKHCEYPAINKCTHHNEGETRFCVNGGTCPIPSTVNGIPMSCNCPPEFSGPHCEFHASTAPSCNLQCKNEGKCQLGYRDQTAAELGFPLAGEDEVNLNYQHCVCPKGFGGVRCEVEHDKCSEMKHCYHGSTCEEFNNPITGGVDFKCNCLGASTSELAFAGELCEHKSTTFCVKHAGVNGHSFCTNGGTCVDIGNGIYDCECLEGFKGDRCQNPTSGAHTPDEIPDFSCNLDCGDHGKCRMGAKSHGVLEELRDVSHIISNRTAKTSYEHCECATGYSGVLCNIKTQLCGEDEHVCFHGSKCVKDEEDWRCNCEEAEKKAAGEFCQHEGTSSCPTGEDPDGFCTDKGVCTASGCQCIANYAGSHCESLVDESNTPWNSPEEDPYKIALIVVACVLGFIVVVLLFVLWSRTRYGKEGMPAVIAPPPASFMKGKESETETPKVEDKEII